MITYPDSVQYLYSLGNEVKTIKMGLERIRTMLAALEHPERACRHVHVAGTNGKGSTCAMLESCLRAAGQRTGLFTSPHLVEPTERIQIDGRPVSPDRFARAFEQVHAVSRRLLDDGAIDGHPTYFETVTAMGFLLFREFEVDIAVIEVGLGGRLDATNVVMPQLCVITPVDYDHESWLGSSIRAIAGEKAGILKAGVPVVLGRQRPEALERILETAAATGSPVTGPGAWQARNLALECRGSRFTAARAGRAIEIECPLAGDHQVDNALTAIAALDLLGPPDAAIRDGIRAARWPGRLEVVAERPEVILDGAHNPAAIRALAAYIDRFYRRRRVWLIYSTMRDKSVAEIGELLAPLASELVLTAADSPRSLRPEVLRSMFPHPNARSAPRLPEALDIVRREASPEDTVFITGSLFLVGEARALLAPTTVCR
jgi:dihydrofolate synthase/folylpolyglutamate synthase